MAEREHVEPSVEEVQRTLFCDKTLTQMGLVIKAARGRLGGFGRYDEQELQNAVRVRLRGKP